MQNHLAFYAVPVLSLAQRIGNYFSFLKGTTMPTFMFQGCYATGAIAAMVKKPEDRTAAVRELTESLGGTLEGFWLSFGAFDFVGIVTCPDSQSAAAFAVAASSSGAVRHFQTTELLSWADGMKAFKKAGSAKYRPPMKAAK
jgi:uncharacterized protein with GYD domain